jgi:hypothetical protein
MAEEPQHRASNGRILTANAPWANRGCEGGEPRSEVGPLALLQRFQEFSHRQTNVMNAHMAMQSKIENTEHIQPMGAALRFTQ